jgi:transcriptional regulator with XRE-family HTH domain
MSRPDTPAQRARAAIRALGWTQRKAAKALGVHHVTIAKWLAKARVDDGERLVEASDPPMSAVQLLESWAAGCPECGADLKP